MVIGIVGIILLSRLHEARWANQRQSWPPLEGGGNILPQERLPMRKIKEVLRLHSLGLSQRQIAASCAISPATVSDSRKIAKPAGLNRPPIPSCTNDPHPTSLSPTLA